MNKFLLFIIIIFATASCKKSELTLTQPDKELSQQEIDRLTAVFGPELTAFYLSLKDTAVDRQVSALNNFIVQNDKKKKDKKLEVNSENGVANQSMSSIDPTEQMYLAIDYSSVLNPDLTLGVIQYDLMRNVYERTAVWLIGSNPFGFWDLYSSELLTARFRPTNPSGRKYEVTEAYHYGSYLQGLTMNVISYSENSHSFTISTTLGVTSLVHGTLQTILTTQPVGHGLIMQNPVTFPG